MDWSHSNTLYYVPGWLVNTLILCAWMACKHPILCAWMACKHPVLCAWMTCKRPVLCAWMACKHHVLCRNYEYVVFLPKNLLILCACVIFPHYSGHPRIWFRLKTFVPVWNWSFHSTDTKCTILVYLFSIVQRVGPISNMWHNDQKYNGCTCMKHQIDVIM